MAHAFRGHLGFERICDYSVGVLQSPSGLRLYVGKSAPKIEAKKARWLVTDEMIHPPMPPNHQLVYGVCRLNGKKDDTILAVVRNQKVEWYKDIYIAYRVDLSSGRFEKIQTKGIECLNDYWGAE